MTKQLTAGQRITVERHPIYHSNNTPAYRTSVKVVESVKPIERGGSIVRLKGVRDSLHCSESQVHGALVLTNTKLKYVVID